MWTKFTKTYVTIRLHFAMTLLKPPLNDYRGAAEQAMFAVHDLKPYTTAQELSFTKEDEDAQVDTDRKSPYPEAMVYQTKAYFRLGTAQYSMKDYGDAVCSFEKSIQAASDAKANGPEAILVRKLAEAKREYHKEKQRRRKKFKAMFDGKGDDDSEKK